AHKERRAHAHLAARHSYVDAALPLLPCLQPWLLPTRRRARSTCRWRTVARDGATRARLRGERPLRGVRRALARALSARVVLEQPVPPGSRGRRQTRRGVRAEASLRRRSRRPQSTHRVTAWWC